jgi:hypothetical protein
MEPIEIRYNRYEGSIALRWAGDENWYRIEHDHLRYGDAERRFLIGPNAFENTPDEEWIDPFKDPRPDIRRWTEPIRAQLRNALTMLDAAERHPWSG